jgi:hypothetical protein
MLYNYHKHTLTEKPNLSVTNHTYKHFIPNLTQHEGVVSLSQETTMHQETKTSPKPAASIQTLLDSLKSAGDDIGQITELSSEEKLLIAEFFKSILKLMQPLTSAISVNPAALSNVGKVVQAHVDPTGHLSLVFEDGQFMLKDLAEDGNRDLMISVAEDVLPKFKNLTSNQKRKVENRIKFLSSVTKEMQKMSEALSSVATQP